MSILEVTAKRVWGDKLPDGVQRFVYLAPRSWPTIVGLVITLFSVLLAILAPMVATHDPILAVPRRAYQPPSREHLMGTDGVGWDVFSRTVYAARVDLYVAFAATLASSVIGTFVGAITGYFGGKLDAVVMRFLDSLQAFPALILAMAVTAAIGRSIPLLIGVIALINFPGYLRVVRGEMKSRKESAYAEAARAVGNPSGRIIFRHLLPNCLAPVFARVPLNAGWAILVTASLSFIGLGVPIPTPEWGAMVADGADGIVTGHWWIALFPGLASMVAILGLNLLGEGLRDLTDPMWVEK